MTRPCSACPRKKKHSRPSWRQVGERLAGAQIGLLAAQYAENIKYVLNHTPYASVVMTEFEETLEQPL